MDGQHFKYSLCGGGGAHNKIQQGRASYLKD
jgi:hypothetical protein